MCRVNATATKLNGKRDVTVICMDSGKPVVSSDKYGMYCEDRCGRLNSMLLHYSLLLFLSPLTWLIGGGIMMGLAAFGLYSLTIGG